MKKLQITALLSVVMVAGLQASDAAKAEGIDSEVQVAQECLVVETAPAADAAQALAKLSLADKPVTGVMVAGDDEDEESGAPTKKTAEQAAAVLAAAAQQEEADGKEEAAGVKPAVGEVAL